MRAHLLVGDITSVTVGRDWFDWYVRIRCGSAGTTYRFNTGSEREASRQIRERLRSAAKLDGADPRPVEADQTVVLFLHGIGSPERTNSWLDALNRSLRLAGYAPIDAVLDPDYSDALAAPTDSSIRCTPTWIRPTPAVYDRAQRNYDRRRHELWQALKPLSGSPRGTVIGNRWVASRVARSRYGAPAYINSPRARASVWHCIPDRLPQTGRVVIVGYSLGSVIAADLPKYLPRHLEVAALITIGSPLRLSDFRIETQSLESEFPYDRVNAWVNFYDPRDEVTVGRGISAELKQVVDVEIDAHATTLRPTTYNTQRPER